MPDGGNKNWGRVCAAVDGFRVLHGRWPKRVRVMPISFDNLVTEVLSPIGFALVSSYVELVPEDEAAMIADDATGAEYNYGEQGFPQGELDPPTREWCGEAVLRPDLAGSKISARRAGLPTTGGSRARTCRTARKSGNQARRRVDRRAAVNHKRIACVWTWRRDRTERGFR